MSCPDLTTLDEDRLAAWLAGQRWFGAKSRELAGARIVEAITIADGDAGSCLAVALAEVRFPEGTHDLYQLLLDVRPADEAGDGADALGFLDGHAVCEAVGDPAAGAVLAGLLGSDATVGEDARVVFGWDDASGVARPGSGAVVRPVGAEQSNTSVVIDDDAILKLFRHIEPGENPELEMLRFLTHRGFPHVAALGGSFAYAGETLDATLGVAQRFVAGGRDGWELVLDGLGEDPEALLPALGGLGEVVGAMHTALASDEVDPAFAPEDPTEESLALSTATLDEQIERLFLDLPDDDERLAGLAGRGEEARDRVRMVTHAGAVGRAIRHHGDFHLGQTLRVPDLPGVEGPSWILLDFEGEPARPLLERRQKRSPLRDVAGLLRSLSYAASASRLQRGVDPPAEWESRARAAFLAGYRRTVDESLLPPGEQATRALLGVLELEKAAYELRYELNHRPDWVPIPAGAILRLLDEELA